VAQGVGPELKPQYYKEGKKKKSYRLVNIFIKSREFKKRKKNLEQIILTPRGNFSCSLSVVY
jgi:hypothetical protein